MNNLPRFAASSLLRNLTLSAFATICGALLLAAPASAETQASETKLAKNSAPHEKVAAAVPPAPSLDVAHTLTPEDAKRLAVQHLTLRNNRWGNPVEVMDEQDNYVVTFNTPEQETQLIGKRAVLIDKESGLAHLRERR